MVSPHVFIVQWWRPFGALILDASDDLLGHARTTRSYGGQTLPYSGCDSSDSGDDRFLHEDQFPWLEGLSQVHLLSDRELQVFLLLSHGYSNREIAALLGVTERTVKAHMAQILAKLGVESRLQAGLVAFAHGLPGHIGDAEGSDHPPDTSAGS
ncbi:response regulator transcription factor [Streptomyces viridochromogenes]|uniref:response regulator transcription factor n=1 Tax=Streptomyces viridochromogenes TaxID=1938 RepID=UPI0009982833